MIAFFDRLLALTTAQKVLPLSALLLSATAATADTLVLQAIDDFPNRTSGVVPFYTETARGSLAINAANVDYRDEYAKAETTFSGSSGVYDVTLVGLAELDGEAPYRFSINGSIVGEARNPVTRVDFLPMAHRFEGITLSTGDVIAIESLANSNEKIPENGGYAFARGRWTEVRLTPEGDIDTQPGKVSLVGIASTLTDDLSVGEMLFLDYAAINRDSASATATNVRMLIHVPEEFEITDTTQCTVSDEDHSTATIATCRLAELAPGESTSGQIHLAALAETVATSLDATVIATQQDVDGADNRASLEVSVAPAQEVTPAPAPAPAPTIELEPEPAPESTTEIALEPTPETTTAITEIALIEQGSTPTSSIAIPTSPELDPSTSNNGDLSSIDESDNSISIDEPSSSSGSLNLSTNIGLFIFLLASIRRKASL